MKRRRDGETARRQDGARVGRGDAGVARGSARRRSGEPDIVEIRPEPSPSERVAILAAIDQMLERSRRAEAPRLAAWAQAGRRESIGRGGSGTGWGRGNDRLQRR